MLKEVATTWASLKSAWLIVGISNATKNVRTSGLVSRPLLSTKRSNIDDSQPMAKESSNHSAGRTGSSKAAQGCTACAQTTKSHDRAVALRAPVGIAKATRGFYADGREGVLRLDPARWAATVAARAMR